MASPRLRREYSLGPKSDSNTNSPFSPDKNRGYYTRRRLSATELLNFNLGQADKLFPLIDTKTYQAKAPFAIYNVEITDTAEEIEVHLEKKSRSNLGDQFEIGVGYRPPNSSLNNIAEDKELPNPILLNEDPIFDIPTCQGEDCREFLTLDKSENSGHDQQDRLRRLSIPVVFANNISDLQKMANYNRRRPSCVSIVWFGCKMEFMAVSQRLKIQLLKDGNLMCETIQRKPAKLFGKMSILPGNIQKQCLDVSSTESDQSAAYFCGMSRLELCRMTIGVKIYMRRGFIKRPKLVHEWTIDLENVNFTSPQTAWKKVECYI